MHALITWLNQLNLEVSNCSSETLMEDYSIEIELTIGGQSRITDEKKSSFTIGNSTEETTEISA